MTNEELEAARLTAVAVNASRFADRPNDVVVVFANEERRVVLRAAHAGWLASRGATKAAAECLRRKVPFGHVLAWSAVVGIDDPKRGRFFDVDIVGASVAQNTKGERHHG